MLFVSWYVLFIAAVKHLLKKNQLHGHGSNITYMGVSKNNGTPKSSILIGFSIINHPFWGTPIFGNIHIDVRYMVLVYSLYFLSALERNCHSDPGFVLLVVPVGEAAW